MKNKKGSTISAAVLVIFALLIVGFLIFSFINSRNRFQTFIFTGLANNPSYQNADAFKSYLFYIAYNVLIEQYNEMTINNKFIDAGCGNDFCKLDPGLNNVFLDSLKQKFENLDEDAMSDNVGDFNYNIKYKEEFNFDIKDTKFTYDYPEEDTSKIKKGGELEIIYTPEFLFDISFNDLKLNSFDEIWKAVNYCDKKASSELMQECLKANLNYFNVEVKDNDYFDVKLISEKRFLIKENNGYSLKNIEMNFKLKKQSL